MLRAAGLRAARFAGRHHFSVLSAAVLVAALALALTSAGFEANTRPQAAPVQALTTPEDSSTASAPAGPTRLVVYYLVKSVAQIDVLKETLRTDTVYLVQQGLPPMPPVAIHFLLFDTPAAESFGARFLNDAMESAPREGYTLQLVDLTQ